MTEPQRVQYYDINVVPLGHFFQISRHYPVMCKVAENLMRDARDTSSIYVPIPDVAYEQMVEYIGPEWNLESEETPQAPPIRRRLFTEEYDT